MLASPVCSAIGHLRYLASGCRTDDHASLMHDLLDYELEYSEKLADDQIVDFQVPVSVNRLVELHTFARESGDELLGRHIVLDYCTHQGGNMGYG